MTSRRAGVRGDPFKFDDALQYAGPLYAYMVWTWKFVFGPAVTCAFLGFLLLVIDTEDISLIVPAAVALLGVVIYYFITRPLLGAD